MDRAPQSGRRPRKPPKPLDSARLEELALSYVARFATSAGKLEAYLKRKVRERGWDGEGEPPVKRLVGRYVELGYIDDAGYARARQGGLLRRGYGPRRVEQALHAAGIDEGIRADVREGEAVLRQAALVMARKRRFGPFAAEPVSPERREKQFAAMVRAGHGFDAVRALLDAASVADAEAWVAEAEEDAE